MYCEFCDGVEEPQLLDVNGVQGSKSGSKDVCWCHAHGDTSWPCPAKAAEEHAEVERLVGVLFQIRRLSMRRDGFEAIAHLAVDAVLSYDEPHEPTEGES